MIFRWINKQLRILKLNNYAFSMEILMDKQSMLILLLLKLILKLKSLGENYIKVNHAALRFSIFKALNDTFRTLFFRG